MRSQVEARLKGFVNIANIVKQPGDPRGNTEQRTAMVQLPYHHFHVQNGNDVREKGEV